ncbi:type II secretion system ATPase GspE [Litoribacillus peritrichatus]|uniref:Type II secretion system protein E n=1 Tax=Litoribacillus peritrichatus TaxID=718191 RepID=A0ABP7MFA3_9GAMM
MNNPQSISSSNVTPALITKQDRLPYGFAKKHGVLLELNSTDAPTLYVKKETPLFALTEVQRILNCPFSVSEVTDDEFEDLIASQYQAQSSDAMQMVEGIGEDMNLESLADSVPESEDLLEQEDDAPIIRLINAILTEAIKENASDIHIETFERNLTVRFRIDGVLREIVQPKRQLAPLLVSRIKVMAKLDIAEKRVPQDGRISLRIAGREVDVRVSTMPASNGERVVLRLLDKNATRLDLSHLGMIDRDYKLMTELVNKPHGIILVTGPTGSGKTTTLYASLSDINDQSRNILTVEDPIEYNLPGIGQTQVNTKADMTFARGLRAILRQDPDVVMIGEIRDKETAEIAVQASLTGHLVLSTLHTNTAVGAVTRLQDMGVEPFLISSSLLGALAQRLVRTLCEQCKKPYVADEATMKLLGLDPDAPAPTLYHPVGCDNCNNGGYKGRQGIYELIHVDDEMRNQIHSCVGEQAMNSHARKLSPSIRQDGMEKVMQGITTVEEVLRVTRED